MGLSGGKDTIVWRWLGARDGISMRHACSMAFRTFDILACWVGIAHHRRDRHSNIALSIILP